MKSILDQILNQIIDVALRVYVAFWFCMLIFFLLTASSGSFHPVYYAYSFGLISYLLLYIVRKRVQRALKAHLFAMVSLMFGLADIVFPGHFAGYFMLLPGVVIAALILGASRAIVYALGSTVLLTLAVIFYIVYHPGQSPLFDDRSYLWMFWLELAFSMLISLLIAILSIRKLYNRLFNYSLNSTEEQKKFYALFDQAYSFITLLDNEGKILEVNQAALFYIDRKSDEVRGLYFSDSPWWQHSPQVKHVVDNMLKASLNGDFKRFEITHQNKDGKIEFFDYNFKPIFDENDNLKLIIAEGRDITRLKRTEQALSESEERLLAFSESTYEGLIITNLEKIVDANESVLRMFGYAKPSDIIGKKVYKGFVGGAHHRALLEMMSGNFSGPNELSGIRKDGSEFPIEAQGREIIYKGDPHVIIAIRDLSERKRAQKALIDSEEKYRLIAENISDIIFKTDKQFNINYVSSSVYTMLGYTVEEAMDLSIKELFNGSCLRRLLKIMVLNRNVLLDDSVTMVEPISFELQVKHRNGSLLWLNISIRVIPSVITKNAEILGVCRNIDELKKTQFSLSENENRLISQNEEYERLNDELKLLNKHLVAAKEKAEESDKLKSSFLANMSHEIRTPMNSIIGFSKMCLRDQLEEEKRKKYASYVIENGEHLLGIVNDILDLSKIEAGQVKIKPEVFCLNGLIESLYLNFHQHNSKGLLLMMQKGLPDSLCQVYGDKMRIMQVMGNLMNNAMKFTAKGHIRFGYALFERQILFSVEDTGIGIKPEHQSSIFERFRQADLETTRIYGGTGLGLAICKRLVELMGGQIWLNSEHGKGSSFFFSIPYKPADSIEFNDDTDYTAEPILITKPVILIVEDEESNFLYLNEILSENKYDILWAKNGREAIELCNENTQIRLVLMDIRMPGMDGFTATRLIKEVRPKLPVVAQTAYAMITDRDTAIAQGCDDYLAKPIDQELLLKTVRRFID